MNTIKNNIYKAVIQAKEMLMAAQDGRVTYNGRHLCMDADAIGSGWNKWLQEERMTLAEINQMLVETRRQSIRLASAILAAMVSYGWDENGRWLCPSTEACMANYSYAKKRVSKGQFLTYEDMVPLW